MQKKEPQDNPQPPAGEKLTGAGKVPTAFQKDANLYFGEPFEVMDANLQTDRKARQAFLQWKALEIFLADAREKFWEEAFKEKDKKERERRKAWKLREQKRKEERAANPPPLEERERVFAQEVKKRARQAFLQAVEASQNPLKVEPVERRNRWNEFAKTYFEARIFWECVEERCDGKPAGVKKFFEIAAKGIFAALFETELKNAATLFEYAFGRCDAAKTWEGDGFLPPLARIVERQPAARNRNFAKKKKKLFSKRTRRQPCKSKVEPAGESLQNLN